MAIFDTFVPREIKIWHILSKNKICDIKCYPGNKSLLGIMALFFNTFTTKEIKIYYTTQEQNLFYKM